MMLKPALRPPMRPPMRGANAPREGVGGPWLPNMARLANAYDLATGIPSISGTPPTVTAYQTSDTGIAVSYAIGFSTNRAAVRSRGGALVDYGGNAGLQATTVNTGSNIGTGKYQDRVIHEIETGSPNIEFRIFRQGTTRVRILTRDSAATAWQYAGAGVVTMNTLASSTCVKVAYSGALAGRQTAIELAWYPSADSGTAGVLIQIRVDTGYTSVAPASPTHPVKLLILGDSFIQGGNTTFRGDGIPSLLGWQLNAEVTCSGIGGTGLIANTSGTQPNLQNRLDDALLQSFDAIIVAMGTNDVGQADASVTAAANVVLNGLKSRVPLAPQFWITPWDLEAPGALAANKVAVRDAMKAATVGKGGVWTLDPTGVTFTQSSSHPDDAGALTLANWVKGQIGTILAAY